MLRIDHDKRARTANVPAASKNDKQVMDVSKPGKTAPTASSKPIIVGHGLMVQDPMVTADVNAEEEKSEITQAVPEVASPANSKRIIAPLTSADKEVVADNKSSTTETSEASSPESTEEVKTEVPEPSTEETSDSAVVDAVIDQVGSKKKENAVSEEDRKRQEHIEKLVAEKKYFVPIGKFHGKSSGIIVTTTLLLLVIFIGLIAAIDAEVIDAGFSLPFDFL